MVRRATRAGLGGLQRVACAAGWELERNTYAVALRDCCVRAPAATPKPAATATTWAAETIAMEGICGGGLGQRGWPARDARWHRRNRGRAERSACEARLPWKPRRFDSRTAPFYTSKSSQNFRPTQRQKWLSPPPQACRRRNSQRPQALPPISPLPASPNSSARKHPLSSNQRLPTLPSRFAARTDRHRHRASRCRGTNT